MAEGKGTPTLNHEKEPDKRPPWWKRLWEWTEFGKKSGWDLLQLLIVPLALAVIGLWFTAQQDARQQQIENQRAEAERKLAEQRAQDEALQAYLDQMGSLLLEKDLRASEEDSEVRTLARARTLTVLRRLDPSRKTAVMQFLVEAELIQRVEGRGPIIRLGGGNLRGANLYLSGTPLTDLSGTDLRGANLSAAKLGSARLDGANLSAANLRDTELSFAFLEGANLSGTDLRGADLSDAYLASANLRYARGVTEKTLEKHTGALKALRGATMPTDQYVTYEFEPVFAFVMGEDWETVPLETTDSARIQTRPEGGQLLFTNPSHVFDPSNPSEAKGVTAPQNVNEWVSWFQRHPNLDTSKPVPVSVGGASGMQIDVTASPTPETSRWDLCGEQPCLPLYPSGTVPNCIGPGNKPCKSAILSYEGFRDRFAIVDVGGETVVIDVAAPEDKFDQFLPKVQKVLDTVEWRDG